MKTTFIYALCEPGTRTVRYIGKSANPNKRFKQHVRESVHAKTHLGHWLSRLVSAGAVPAMVVIRQVMGSGSLEEKRCIRLARRIGMKLVNGTDGGDGGSGSPSLATRKKVSDKLKGRFSGNKNPFFGRTHTTESRELMGAAHKGVPLPPGHPLIGWGKGQIRSAEHRANLSAALTGYVKTPEHCAAISAGRIAANLRRKERDQEIEWALAPYTLE